MRNYVKLLSSVVLFVFFALLTSNVFAVSFVEDININSYTLALIPCGHGRVVSTGTYRKAIYPSVKQSMQFMMFYNTGATTGYYVQTEDSTGYVTDWEILTVNGIKTLRLTFYCTVKPNVVKQTITIDPAKPYLSAAEKYKTWAFQQSWAKRKVSKFDYVKIVDLGASPYFDWLRNTELPPYLSQFEEADTSIDKPATATFLSLWRSDPFNVYFPRYTPATYGGSFSALLSALHSRGSIPMPYKHIRINIYNINLASYSFRSYLIRQST